MGSGKLEGDLFLLLCECLTTAGLHRSDEPPGPPGLCREEMCSGSAQGRAAPAVGQSWAAKAAHKNVHEERIRGLQALCVVL